MIAVLICGAVAHAADPALPVLIISEKGYAWMISDSNGKPVLYEFSQVIVLGKPGTVTPQVPPTFSFLEPSLVLKLDGFMTGLSATGRADLPAVVHGVKDTSDMAIAGKFKTLGEVEAVAAALLRAAIKDKAAWAPIATAIDEALVKLQADGKIVTPADYGKALADLAKVLK